MAVIDQDAAIGGAPIVAAAPASALRLATWNINSVRIRLRSIRRFVRLWRPDVLCLQETKARDEHFPVRDFERMGFPHMAIRGEKGYNGVAILSRLPLADIGSQGWCGRTDCRHVSAVLPGGIELHNFYVPAGGDVPDPDANPKFAHKLQFLGDMADWFAERRRDDARMVLVGDLNVAPLETDVWSHKQLLKVVSHTPVEVALLNRVQASHDWVDAVRHFVPADEKLYTWWSYRAPDWAKADKGRRLDHVWVTPALAGALRAAEVARGVRGWQLASDHAPVMVTLELAP